MEISQSTLWKQRGNIFKRMTTIFTISTQTFSRTTLLRWLLGAACLLVMVGMQSCRTAAISATALDLNNYQTGKTLPQNTMAAFVQVASAPSVIAGMGYDGSVSQSISSLAFTAMVGIEASVADGWDISAAGQCSATNLFLDGDAGFKASLKKALTDSHSFIAASLLLTGGVLWGSESRLSQIYVPRDFFTQQPLQPQTSFVRDHSITSQLHRIGIALPMSRTVQPNAHALPEYSSLQADIDIVLTPAVHFVSQNMLVRDEPLFYGSQGQRPTQANIREFNRLYVVPSLSFGLNWQTAPVHIFPEFTLGWANQGLTFGIGVSLRQTAIRF